MKTRVLALVTITLLAATLVLSGCSATPAPTAAAATSAASVTAAAQQTFTGYLVDQKCGLSGVDIQDGTDLTKNPEKHQLTCAMMPGCLASGFGLFMKQADGTYKFYQFDSNGSKIAIDNVINKTKKADNFLVDVMGTVSGDTITVASITEK